MDKKNIPLKERIIFALDVDSLEKAEKWVDLLEDHIHFYKVGLQLFIGGWFPVIDMILNRGHKVMLDLKFFDIPETVKLALMQLTDRPISFVTVHGNNPIIKAAVSVKKNIKILGVTVLTSFNQEDMIEMGSKKTVEELVFTRAKKAIELGCDGVVSSGLEAKRLRDGLGENFLIVSPGIRPGKNTLNNKDDQQRIITAQNAIIKGADHIVVGRPISKADDPISVVKSMQDEIQKALPH